MFPKNANQFFFQISLYMPCIVHSAAKQMHTDIVRTLGMQISSYFHHGFSQQVRSRTCVEHSIAVCCFAAAAASFLMLYGQPPKDFDVAIML